MFKFTISFLGILFIIFSSITVVEFSLGIRIHINCTTNLKTLVTDTLLEVTSTPEGRQDDLEEGPFIFIPRPAKLQEAIDLLR